METEQETDLRHLVQITSGMLASGSVAVPSINNENQCASREKISLSAAAILIALKKRAELLDAKREEEKAKGANRSPASLS
ncbi:MAG: hypothetical protein V4710_17880 [Verrucomicrobiota bacterium]